jgi:hypothetical protein|tara:strand:+ start:388 stop:594 length:207 start_codon:yes stop_codon:yes gene_type:complete
MPEESHDGPEREAEKVEKGKVGVVSEHVHHHYKHKKKKAVESASFHHNVQTLFLEFTFCNPCLSLLYK